MSIAKFKAYYFKSNFEDDEKDDILALSNNECSKTPIQIKTSYELADNLYRIVLDDATHPYTLAISEVLLDTGKSHHNFTHGQIAEYQNIDPEQYADTNTMIVDIRNGKPTAKRDKETLIINHPTEKQWIIIARTPKKENTKATQNKRTKILDEL